MQAARPQISIIIEWENVKLSEMDRCREMLRAIARQIPEYFDKQPGVSASDPVPAKEILILYDGELRAGKGSIFHSIAQIGKWQLKAFAGFCSSTIPSECLSIRCRLPCSMQAFTVSFFSWAISRAGYFRLG